MPIGRTSLRSFLVNAKASLRTAVENNGKVTLVIGNESADLDSLTCSVLFSYIRSSKPPRQAYTPLYIPVVNIPAADLKLRPEFLKLLRHSNLAPEHLITLDDLPDLDSIEDQLPPQNTHWILVDHNALQGKLGAIYSSRVCGVIDHHDDEHKVPMQTGDEPRVIGKTGSCTSFVTNYFREDWDALSGSSLSSGAANAQGDSVADDGAVSKVWDAQVAKLALASILIDTSNLLAKDKTTKDDEEAVKYLEAKINTSGKDAASFDRTAFYDEVDKAKKDIDSLALQDILRKDYKEWTEGEQRLGISSVVKPITFLQEKAKQERSSKGTNASFLGALSEFARVRELDIFSIMTTSTSEKGDFQRELLVWAYSRRAIAAAEQFSTSASSKLGLEVWKGLDGSLDAGSEKEWRRVWWQRMVENSRKQVAPLLREALNSTTHASL